MIELNSVTVILSLEALFALLVAVAWLLFSSRKTNTQTFNMAEQLVDNLENAEVERTKKLSELIAANCQVDPQTLKALLQDIALHEKALYRLLVQIILHHDPELLNELQEYVYALAKPYCKLLQLGATAYHAPVLEQSTPDMEGLAFANKEIVRLADENTALIDQLQQALKAADDIAEEYSRVFTGKQEEGELRDSAKRMLAIFADALDKAKAQSAISLMDESRL